MDCGNCDCADKSSCMKKGDSAEHIFNEHIRVDHIIYPGVVKPGAAEWINNDGKCKCGPSCSCSDCSCGSH